MEQKKLPEEILIYGQGIVFIYRLLRAVWLGLKITDIYQKDRYRC